MTAAERPSVARHGDAAPPATSLAILTVVRDDRPGLIATRDSLRAQRWRGFDWIVVDGASTDGTAEWLTAHAAETVWWRSAPDRGLYDAMNIALAAARSSHVLFLNAGDRLATPDSAALILEAAARHPDADLLYGDALERLPDGHIVVKPARSHRLAVFGMFTHHQAMIYRRTALNDLSFNLRYAIAADYALTLEVLRRGGPAVHLPIPLCVFTSGGRSQRAASLGRREQALIRSDLLGFGLLTNATIGGLQWLTLTIRRCAPRLYAQLRFRKRETSFLS